MNLVVLVSCLLILCNQPVRIQARSKGNRIISGHDTQIRNYPYTAAIYKKTNSGIFFCTGALISNQWLATAGQCVTDATKFTIRLGSESLSRDDPNALDLVTKEYVLHPDFDPVTLENDVGLIKLRQTVTFTEYIKPLNFTSDFIKDYRSVQTVGWGQISDDQAGLVDILQYVYLLTMKNEECKNIYGPQISDNMICVQGDNRIAGTCRGDLGSPLILMDNNIVYYLVGVSSWISANGCETYDPSGFTRIAPYLSWINNVTSNVFT
ncbi:brachyurin-like [Zophobas morio]|uniref:brachyurin-like n=1 Tax=Zophobas morio TaxID=2755281 RepID=UPI003082D282